LFRQGPHTLGAAHFEFLIPDTTEHEVLGWELPRDIVTVDMVRTGALVAPPAPAMLVDVGGHYRDIRPPVFNALVGVADLHPLLTVLELPLTPQAAPVPIPFDGVAMVFRAAIAPDPVQAHLFDALTINFNQVIEKPFCNGPTDYVLVQGPVRLVLNVHTNPSGFFSRTYDVGANLRVTPFNPVTRMPTGPTVPAVVTEWHRAQLTNRYGELREIQNRQLLGATPQTFFSDLASGKRDGYIKEIVCGATP
jgi:hypothetical protein